MSVKSFHWNREGGKKERKSCSSTASEIFPRSANLQELYKLTRFDNLWYFVRRKSSHGRNRIIFDFLWQRVMSAKREPKDKKSLMKYGVCIHLLQQKLSRWSISINRSPGESRKDKSRFSAFLLTRSRFRIFDDGVSFSMKDLEITS